MVGKILTCLSMQHQRLNTKMITPGKLAIALCSVLLFGCVADTWIRPDTTKDDMRRDLEQCQRDREAVSGESFFVERCMFSKGYSEK